jgi:uncharacterized protein YciI
LHTSNKIDFFRKDVAMPAWNDYRRDAKARGALALELYAVHSVPAKPPADMQAVLPDHLAYQRKLEENGALALAGPLSDETGAQMQGMGLMIYRAASLDDARRIAEADPMHASGCRTFTLRRWLINEGGLTVAIGLSTGRVGLS